MNEHKCPILFVLLLYWINETKDTFLNAFIWQLIYDSEADNTQVMGRSP